MAFCKAEDGQGSGGPPAMQRVCQTSPTVEMAGGENSDTREETTHGEAR